MDNKTEELRDIFLDVTDEETVTESQEAERGSLTGNDRSVGERLRGVVEELREKFTFGTGLDDGEYCEIVRLFYDGMDDDAIAGELSCSAEDVFYARLDLHLVRDDDPPGAEIGEETRQAVRDRLAGDSVGAVAEELSLDREDVRRAEAVIESQNRSRRVSQRFRTAFEEILTDTDLTVQFAADTHDDGLDEATEGAEVDVDF